MPSALIRVCVLASVFAATAVAQDGADAPRCELFEFRALMPLERAMADLEHWSREELRVLAWLEVGDHRSRVLADPREFHRFYESLARYAEGGNWSPTAWRWYPHVVRLDDAGRARFIGNARFRKPEVAIWLFAEGEARDETHVRIELVPVDRASGGFVTDDLVADSFAVVPVESGETGVVYRVRAEREEAYGDWTEARIGQRVAVIVDGVIVSAPIVMSRLPGRGMISGSADAEHVERWIECVRTANRSDPGVVTERGESDERDDAEMRAVLELDRRVSAAKTEYEGDSGLVRSVEQVVEA
ncbi:MAG: hypothetical protein KDB80_16525, partial [Planctomycetes bacterium]|nr:hypothetical protein [Planctomycetota bacterium]